MGAIWRTIRFAKEEVERELNGSPITHLFFMGLMIQPMRDSVSGLKQVIFGASIGLAMDHLATALHTTRNALRTTHIQI